MFNGGAVRAWAKLYNRKKKTVTVITQIVYKQMFLFNCTQNIRQLFYSISWKSRRKVKAEKLFVGMRQGNALDGSKRGWVSTGYSPREMRDFHISAGDHYDRRPEVESMYQAEVQ